MVHPLSQLIPSELEHAVSALKAHHSGKAIHIKSIASHEPPKDQVIEYLQAEKAGKALPSIKRVAYCIYYVISEKRLCELWINLTEDKVDQFVQHKRGVHPPIDLWESQDALDTCMKRPEVTEAAKKCGLDDEAIEKLVADPWMYGVDQEGDVPRMMMMLVYSKTPSNPDPDSNMYAFPLPFVPVYDVYEKKFVRIDWCATGGDDDDAVTTSFNYNTRREGRNAIDHCQTNEYLPELQPSLRTDVKPYNVVQPEGPSFTVSNDNLIQWQKWRFRIDFNPREGLVLYDIDYDGRNTFYRLSMSEMAVPYGDPRPPLHRKMAFDFGDAGAGKSANELTLGCDCLGTIKYFDGHLVEPNGNVVTKKNVICMHEQDDGILWKHTNFRTNKPAITRRRILILQTILTVGNYEYIFNWHFDQAGAISIQLRATGIVSTQLIDEGKKSQWGNIVSPGVLATSHQHIFNMRIDPAIDGYKNSVMVNETQSVPWDDKNPYGTGFKNVGKVIEKSCYLDADIQSNRSVKIVNENKINPVSGKPVGYKIIGKPTALLYAQPGSVARKRAAFATHHYWVSKYKDQEFYAGGVWTNQSPNEVGGVSDAVARNENVRNEDVVVWHSFGLTHHPRVEDFPVMPTEFLDVHLTPNDFFTQNPSVDVPPSTQQMNRSVDVMAKRTCHL